MEVQKDKYRFLHGREGDHLVTTFQCDVCHFRNIYKRSPSDFGGDHLALKYIRRANLDALWSRASGTVKGTLREVNNLISRAKILGMDPELMMPPMGPFPVDDIHGMRVAMCILLRSLDEGKNEPTIQFSTTQKMKTAFTNVWRASVRGGEGAVVARDTAKLFHTTCPTHGDWFERFTKGLHERMGDKVKQDLGITIEQIHELMKRYDERWVRAGLDRERQKVVLFPALWCILAFVCALRGEEVPMVSLTGILKHLKESIEHPTLPHVTIALLGRFKNEIGERYHLMPIVLTTASGLEPGKWVYRMAAWYTEGGINTGWVFRDRKGERARSAEYEWDILCELERIQQETNGVIATSVNVFEDFGVSRSFRRGLDTHAINQHVDTADIERNNRWRTVEQAKGKQPRLRMIHHYSEVGSLLKALLRYSQSL